jgi:CBS domain-containing protein
VEAAECLRADRAGLNPQEETMLLKEIMTPNVEAVSVETTLVEAARKMAQLDVGFLPVLGETDVAGVVTDRDIVVRAIAEGDDPKQTTVQSVMTAVVETLPEDTPVEEAAQVMESKQIRRILVTGSHGRKVGVVSLGDIAVKTKDDPLSGEVLERVSEPAHPTR